MDYLSPLIAPSLQDTPVSDAERALSDMTEQRDDLNKRILDTSMFINASRPVNRLPVELLVAIFRYAQDSPPKQPFTAAYAERIERSSPWYPMIFVCRHWHSLVRGTPMLWWLVQVLPETKIEHFELVLSRSKELPVEVEIYSPPSVAPFTEVLLRHRVRIASLHVQGVPRAQASYIQDLVQVPMPALRTLRMWFDPVLADPMIHHVMEEEVFMFSPGSYPELRELSLRGITFQGPLPMGFPPPNLTHFELRDDTTHDFHIFEMTSFLGSCPHLQSIVLVRFRPFDDLFDVFTGPEEMLRLPVIALSPTLQRLVLEDIDVYMARLLSGLQVPASTDVSLTKLISGRDRDELRNT